MKKLKKKLMQIGFNTFNLLPDNIHDKVVRKFFFSVELPDADYKANIKFKIADTKKEVEEALKLIQDCYTETKLTGKSNYKIRINKYKLLPTTTIFVAKYKDEVIATCSQVMDTSLGLPIDHFMDISHIRKKGRRISEITGLAVRKDWRSKSKGVYFPLVSYAVLYCKEVIGTQDIIICTRASVRKFYRAIFGFKHVSKKIHEHSGVNGMMSFAQMLNIESLGEILFKLYGNKSKIEKNCFKVIWNFPWREISDFKKQNFYFLKNSSFKLDTINYFFNEQSDVLRNLTDEDRAFLNSLYSDKGYQEIISDTPLSFKKVRKSPRFYVNMDFYSSNNSKIITNKVFQISFNGFCLQGTNLPENITGEIYLNEKVKCHISARKVWSGEHKSGYEFTFVEKTIWETVFYWVNEKNKENLSEENIEHQLEYVS